MPIQVPFRGIVEIVGEHDTGKTLAALQAVYPWKKTVFVDDDVKGDATVKQMEELEGKKRTDIFADYIDMRVLRTKLGKTPSPTQLLENIIEPVIEQITSRKNEVIIWDTWRIVYQSARGHVERNQHLYREAIKFQGSSVIIQGLISRVARMLEQSYLSELRDSCELLIVTHHIKDWYTNNVVVGVIPESSSTFSEVSTMRMWLRRNPHSKVPIILFLKRPNLPKIVKGKPRFINVVPPKITPNAKDHSVWDAIERYLEDPVESRELRPDEQPTKEEISMISGTLSEDQKLYALDVLKNQKDTEQGVVSMLKEVSEFPENITQLLTMSMTKYGLDMDGVSQATGVGIDEILDGMSGEEVAGAWEKVKEFATSNGGKKVSSK